MQEQQDAKFIIRIRLQTPIWNCPFNPCPKLPQNLSLWSILQLRIRLLSLQHQEQGWRVRDLNLEAISQNKQKKKKNEDPVALHSQPKVPWSSQQWRGSFWRKCSKPTVSGIETEARVAAGDAAPMPRWPVSCSADSIPGAPGWPCVGQDRDSCDTSASDYARARRADFEVQEPTRLLQSIKGRTCPSGFIEI